MIPSVEAPGEKLIIRLWETVDKGLGGLLAPWQTRRLGRAETDVQRERRVALAKAEQDVAAIRSGREYPTLDSPLLTAAAPRERTATHDEAFPHTLATIAHRNLLLERMQAEVNVAKVLLLAEAALQDDVQEPPNRTADDDWLFRWRDSASKVSSEDLRGLWARVLAGEIKSPGSFSLRTLEFLKNLSQAEARSIQQLAPFVLDNDFVCNADDELLQSQGITLGFLIKLQGLGIVTQTSPSLRKILPSLDPHAFKRGVFSYERVLVVSHKDKKSDLRLDGYPLTSLGSQVLRLGSFKSHDAYLRRVGKAIQGQGFKVLLARYTRVTEDAVKYFDPREL